MRINIYSDPADEDGTVRVGHFESDKAERWSDADHNGNGSGGTGRGQALYRTSGGKWVLCNWSLWQGESDRFEYITPERAREWLLRNHEDEAVARYLGPVAEEEDRSPGRPAVGEPVNVRLGDDLLGAIDAYAVLAGTSRAAAIRELLATALGRP
jgi:hypothetical protein